MGEHRKKINYKITSPEIRSLCEADKRLSLMIARYGDLTYTLNEGEFAFIVETIIGQMLSNKAADAIAARLYSLCNDKLSVSVINDLEQRAIKEIGLSDQKASYIKGLATLIEKHPDFFNELNEMDDEDVIKRLTSIRGIGTWSAKMYLIFVLNRLDILPFEDGAFLQAYKWLYKTDDLKSSSIIAKCAPWKPYSSLAVRYLYRALDNGLIRDADLAARLDAIPTGDQ